MRRMVAGEFTRRAGACYESHMRVTSSTNYRSLLIDALDELGLTLTIQKATDVLHCINEEGMAPHTGREVADEYVSLNMELEVERRLTPAEFCVVAAELHCQHHPPSLPPHSLPISSVPGYSKRTTIDNLQRDSQSFCEVFLGGSCNPTVWRKQIAIPLLEQEKITYHNPQVEEWKPELIELEERAKEEARMLFYVVDDKTRAVSSMVELGYYTGQGRRIVAVVSDITGPRPQVAGEDLYTREIEDLNRGRALVRDILDCHSAVLEHSIEDGIRTVAKILRDPSHSCHSVRSNNTIVQVTNVIRVLQQVFTMHDMERKGSLNDTEVALALKSLNVPQDSNFVAAINRLHSYYSRQHTITVEDFFNLYAELRVKSSPVSLSPSPGITNWLWGMLATPFYWISDWMSSFYSLPPPLLDHACGGKACDVFLGGSCGHTQWRTEIAIPILRQHGRTYFNPHIKTWDTGLIPIERHAKENCAVLLFNISGDTLSVASMIEVSFYIGQRRAVVLCLSDISVSEVEGMKLSPAALKDYNRGRAYLASFSQHNGVPVFTDITLATMACIQMINQ